MFQMIGNIVGRLNFRAPQKMDFQDTVADLDVTDVNVVDRKMDDAKLASEVVVFDEDQVVNSKKAFIARPGATKYIIPERTRHKRVHTEAQVYVLIYRSELVALRYVEFHGKLRKEFGGSIKLWKESIKPNQRDDDLLNDAAEDAVKLIHALQNPIEVWDGIEEPLTDAPHPPGHRIAEIAKAASPAPEVSAAPVSSVVPVAPVPCVAPVAPAAYEQSEICPKDDELFRVRGRFCAAGTMPFRSEDGKVQKGKPAFCVLLRRDKDDKEVRVWGADIASRLENADVKCGDLIDLVKHPKERVVREDGRTIEMHMWSCDVIERISNDHSTTSYKQHH
jgi:hypothetical protein